MSHFSVMGRDFELEGQQGPALWDAQDSCRWQTKCRRMNAAKSIQKWTNFTKYYVRDIVRSVKIVLVYHLFSILRKWLSCFDSEKKGSLPFYLYFSFLALSACVYPHVHRHFMGKGHHLMCFITLVAVFFVFVFVFILCQFFSGLKFKVHILCCTFSIIILFLQTNMIKCCVKIV